MAGTTRLELATSAVTVGGVQVLSTTWKSTDGTASHWKYIKDNANVYRESLWESWGGRRVISELPVTRQESRLIARSFAIRREQDHFLQPDQPGTKQLLRYRYLKI